MKINPYLRFVILGVVLLIQFLTLVTYVNNLVSYNRQINDLETEKNSLYSQQQSYEDTAIKKINQDIFINSSGMSRINGNETLKPKDIFPDPKLKDQEKQPTTNDGSGISPR
jgi:hypothetical protein